MYFTISRVSRTWANPENYRACIPNQLMELEKRYSEGLWPDFHHLGSFNMHPEKYTTVLVSLWHHWNVAASLNLWPHLQWQERHHSHWCAVAGELHACASWPHHNVVNYCWYRYQVVKLTFISKCRAISREFVLTSVRLECTTTRNLPGAPVHQTVASALYSRIFLK